MKHFCVLLLAASLLLMLAQDVCGKETPSSYQLSSVPAGYQLQICDDCGVLERQPHVHAKDIYTFPQDQVKGDEKARTVAWDEKNVDVEYDQLPATPPYVLIVTYANETFNHRAQSIWAGGIQIQPSHELPKGKSERLIFRLPAEAIQNGKLHLQFRLEAQVNVVVSAVELWSRDAEHDVLRISGANGLFGNLKGRVLNLAYDPQPGATVELAAPGKSQILGTTKTDNRGAFEFDRAIFSKIGRSSGLKLTANLGDRRQETFVSASDLFFDPVRYRPLAVLVEGVDQPQVSLNGTWRINLDSSDAARKSPINGSYWHDVKVPGQWVEQGFNVPENKPALMSRDFTIPQQWKGQRVILRFDAIHAGTQYWLNGKLLGSSENLFTPVEWDITDFARFGEMNRIDLKMVVATTSERLSYSSGYTGHSLGGIDRAVKIFALPQAHIDRLHLDAGLDEHYQNGNLKIDLGIKEPGTAGLSIRVHLLDVDGKSFPHSANQAIPVGTSELHIRSIVPRPLKWNAEQPNLYKLQIDLCAGGKTLERIERQIGFRKIELRNRQLYVNGVRVKLAGVAHHEVDPLSGRADTARHAEEDVRLYRNANLNYIRTSHYPPTDELLTAADRIGMYVECEAPFCWARPTMDPAELQAILTPTSARIDFCHTHPSIIIWSIANESNWADAFDVANKLTKSLDPTRPTTFNHPFAQAEKENCDIVNRHYLGMPFDAALPNDPRPFLHGECFFELYHSRTDVTTDPGLRELWASGDADPTSQYAQSIIDGLKKSSGLQPGIYPGAWTHIVSSNHFIGSVIWSGVDDIMFTRDGKKYSSENGNAYWGLIDGWRRPKPEYWLAKLVFSPVWFPSRQINWNGNHSSIILPVENRYSFTDLSELTFDWQLREEQGQIHTTVSPGAKGELTLPVPKNAKVGDSITLRVSRNGGLVTATQIHLGQSAQAALPIPSAGAPKVDDAKDKITIQGETFAFAINKQSGELIATDPTKPISVTSFPCLHLTRYDFGDLVPGAAPYAVLPEGKTRKIDGVTAEVKDSAVAITINDHYQNFTGHVTWLVDQKGTGSLSYDYTYTGPDLQTRELGLRLSLNRDCDQLNWHRWSEWDIFPYDHISRTDGTARAIRPINGAAPEWQRPSWPWSLDQTELGTNDFRSVKFNIRQASLLSPSGNGIEIRAHQDAHVRACLSGNKVLLHLLSQCTLTSTTLKSGDHLRGKFCIQLIPH